MLIKDVLERIWMALALLERKVTFLVGVYIYLKSWHFFHVLIVQELGFILPFVNLEDSTLCLAQILTNKETFMSLSLMDLYLAFNKALYSLFYKR